MTQKKLGFTLVEIMIVVAIVMVLIMVATPNILRSRLIAVETTALSNIRTISNACQLYHINKETYPMSLADLAEPVSSPAYIESVLASGDKQGYHFDYDTQDGGFTIQASPTGLWKTLNARYFYTDENGVIHAKTGGPAGPDDEIVK